MHSLDRHVVLGCLLVIFAVRGCTLQPSAGNLAATVTSLSGTLAAVQTGTAVALTASAAAPPPIPTPTATMSSTPTPIATAKNPMVARLTLCWTGPGNAYPVVSSVKPDTVVELLGIGSVPGWYIITNPRYGDMCWIEAKNLQMDPSYDVSRLKVYNPPPTPGPTPTDKPTPTP
jgi:uncharacterized protein YgiM (DUF1202 family)